MAKARTIYVCQNCGRTAPRAMGKCPDCGEWNTMVESVEAPQKKAARAAVATSVARRLTEIDGDAWERQRSALYLFDELIDNVDRHLNNLLITSAFRIRLIDHSRSFGDRGTLRHPERLRRFSRSLLDGLEALTFEHLRAEVGRHVSDVRIRDLLERRDRILELARDRIAQHGETAVIYR